MLGLQAVIPNAQLAPIVALRPQPSSFHFLDFSSLSVENGVMTPAFSQCAHWLYVGLAGAPPVPGPRRPPCLAQHTNTSLVLKGPQLS